MKTVVVISTRGFGVFRHDLLVEPDQVQFVGIFSEYDVANVTDDQRSWMAAVHSVPCGVNGPSTAESSIVDLDAARTIVAELIAAHGTGSVSVLSYDEQNVLSAALLRGEFGLPGPSHEDVLPYRDKCLMKRKLAGTGIRAPRFGELDGERFAADRAACFEAITADVGRPFILKPIDAAAADGVYTIESAGDFADLPAELGRDYEYEEFVEGRMFSVNLVTRDRRTVFGGVTEYLVNSTQVRQGRVNADINLWDADPRVARMVAFAEQVLDALGRLDGASHLELFHTKDDELVFLEVGARFKGLAGLAAMQRNYAIAFVNLALDIEAGLKSREWDEEQVYCFDAVVPKRAGTIERLVEPELESDYSMTWKVQPGLTIEPGTSLSDNGGTFLVWNKDYEAAYRDFERLATYEPIVYLSAGASLADAGPTDESAAAS